MNPSPRSSILSGDTLSNRTIPEITPHWHILGLGAIGGLFACRMTSAGIPVAACPTPTMCNADPVVLTLEEHGAKQAFHIPLDSDKPIRQLLLTTKAQQSETAMNQIAHRLQPDAVVVVLQNGLGVHDVLLARWPQLTIVAGTTTEGVNRPSPQHLRHAGHGTTWLGPWRHHDEPQARHVWQQWQTLNMSLTYDDAIATRLWEKLVMNCAINPLTALLDCRNGALEAQTATRDVMHAVVQEVSALMQALGQNAETEGLFQKVLAVSRSTGANISSMLADQRAGRATEIEFINGYVTRASQACGLAAPVNAWLMSCVQARRRFDAASLHEAMRTSHLLLESGGRS